MKQLYAFLMVERCHIKIGLSKQPIDRIHGQVCQIPEAVWLLGVKPGSPQGEEGLKVLFSPWRVNGSETFHPRFSTVITLLDLLEWPKDLSQREAERVAYWSQPDRDGMQAWLNTQPNVPDALGAVRMSIENLRHERVHRGDGWARNAIGPHPHRIIDPKRGIFQ